MAGFKFYKDRDSVSKGYEAHIGTDDEVFSLGQIVKLDTTGYLTSAEDDTDGIQQYVVVGPGTGDAVNDNILVVAIRASMQFEVTSTGQIAASGAAYTLHTTELEITATTTKGCFVVDYTDGATLSTVIGHFKSADAL